MGEEEKAVSSRQEAGSTQPPQGHTSRRDAESAEKDETEKGGRGEGRKQKAVPPHRPKTY